MAHQINADRRASTAPAAPSPASNRSAVLPLEASVPANTSLARVGQLLLFASAAMLAGCGGTSEETAQRAPSTATKQAAADQATEQPGEIVSRFLDRVRRGGDDSAASELLTKLAQQEMTRIGRPLQLPGSPDTTYEVRKAFPVPGEDDAMWVQTILSEPSEDGQPLRYEVVWTLRQEIHGWRISGFVIDQGDQLEPLQIDFENGDEMEARLAAVESESNAENQ
jgi:hypothetical protein